MLFNFKKLTRYLKSTNKSGLTWQNHEETQKSLVIFLTFMIFSWKLSWKKSFSYSVYFKKFLSILFCWWRPQNCSIQENYEAVSENEGETKLWNTKLRKSIGPVFKFWFFRTFSNGCLEISEARIEGWRFWYIIGNSANL